jgi:hypothetical protein
VPGSSRSTVPWSSCRSLDRHATPHAAHVALEHVLTGADNLNDGFLSFADYAASLIDRPMWSFWWD